MNNNENQGMGYWLGLIMKIVLAAAMIVYLGKHSLNFFTWTFSGEDSLYAWLGLFTTSIGVIIWLVCFKYVAKNTWEKAIALIMMLIALAGEFLVAAFDMYMNISGQLESVKWTPADLRNMSYVVAGLALINGIALVADIAGMDIIDGLKKKEQPIPAPTIFQPQFTQKEQAIPTPILQSSKDEPTLARDPFQESKSA